MNSKNLRTSTSKCAGIPVWLDSTRVRLVRYDRSSNYCCMISKNGNAWVWAWGRLRMQKPHISTCPSIAKRNFGKSYMMAVTDYKYTPTTMSGRSKMVHRCVAQVFVRVPRKLARLNVKLQVDHRNGDRYDNRACNLRWCTQSQNIRYGIRSRKGLPV